MSTMGSVTKATLVSAYEEKPLLSDVSVWVLVIGMFCLERNNFRILKIQHASMLLVSIEGGSFMLCASSLLQCCNNSGVLFQKQATIGLGL